MSLFRARPAAVALVFALLAGCGGSEHTPGPAPVARVDVIGIADTITVGDRRSLAAKLSDASGATLVSRRVTWSTLDGNVATVDSTGVVSAVGPGTTGIAADAEGVRGTLTVHVRRRPVAQVSLDRVADTLWLGRAHPLQARTLATDGTLLVDRSVTWNSADTTIATVTVATDGIVVRGVGVGVTQVVARSEGATSAITVAVVRMPVARVVVTAIDSVLVGRTTNVRADVWAPDGTQFGASDLAGRSVVWESDRAAVLDVTALDDATQGTVSGYLARARGLAIGSAAISATLDGVSGTAPITVVRPPVQRLAFQSSTLALRVGNSTTVTATGFDVDGTPVANAPIVYALTAGGAAATLTAVSGPDGTPSARIDARATGKATVTASADGRTATLTVDIGNAPPTLKVFPTAVTTIAENHGRLSVVLSDAQGSTYPTGVITYRTSNPSIVNIDDLGSFTTGLVGSATVTVTAAGQSVAVPIAVQSLPPSSFHIDVRPFGTVAPEVLAAARRAAARWERIVTSAQPPTQVDLDVSSAAACEIGMPAIAEVTDALIVYVTTKPIDGARGVLAYAGPCVTRAAALGGLPVVGSMTMDAGDVALLTGASGALAEDVLTHELGHVLGIGTMWRGATPKGNLLQDIVTDPTFTGPSAMAAAFRMGMSSSVLTAVPVEDTGGAGTALGHWRERVFQGELMTGWIGAAPNPLSILTVQSLRDLGYAVTETGADIVSPASIAGGSAAFSKSRLPTMQIGERLLLPKFVANKRGTLPPRK